MKTETCLLLWAAILVLVATSAGCGDGATPAACMPVCSGATTCVAGRCVPLDAGAACARNADCRADQVCARTGARSACVPRRDVPTCAESALISQACTAARDVLSGEPTFCVGARFVSCASAPMCDDCGSESRCDLVAGCTAADAGPGAVDAGSDFDAGPGPVDAGSDFDAGPGAVDAGAALDAGPGAVDAGAALDAGPGVVDAGLAVDAGAVDAGPAPACGVGPGGPSERLVHLGDAASGALEYPTLIANDCWLIWSTRSPATSPTWYVRGVQTNGTAYREVLATGAGPAVGLTGSTAIYTRGGGPIAPVEIWKAALDTGTATRIETLPMAALGLTALVADATDVYYVRLDGVALRVALTGGGSTTIASGIVHPELVNRLADGGDGYVYLVHGADPAGAATAACALTRIAKAGGVEELVSNLVPVLPDATVCAGDVAVVGTSAFAVHGAPPGAALSRATLPASVASPVATLLGAPPMLIHALGGRVFTTEPGGPAGAQFRLFDASTGTELAPVLPSRGGRGFDVAGDWIYFVSVTDGVYAIRWR